MLIMRKAKGEVAGKLATLSAELNRASSVDGAVNLTLSAVEDVYDEPVAVFWKCDFDTGSPTPLAASPTATEQLPDTPWSPPEPLAENMRVFEAVGERAEIRRTAEPRTPLQSELLVAIGANSVLSLSSTETDAFTDTEATFLQHIAKMLGGALDRIGGLGQTPTEFDSEWQPSDTSALRRLHELTVDAADFEETIDRLLSLGCEYFGLDTGVLSCVEGTEYKIEAVVDQSGSYEAGTVLDIEETMCAAMLASDVLEPLAAADVDDSKHADRPAAANIGAYIAAPVVFDGETYGTVNFSSPVPRKEQFHDTEQEFVKLLAQWIGSEIGRRERLSDLERYETIVEAVDDPVYALDTDARFTFVNDAAKREFGYGEEILGEHVSVGMKEEDIERVARQRQELVETDKRSMTAQFELETADGSIRLVENRLALIGETSHRGTAGVLRDITDREQRRQQLESFQQAVEEAADGVAILDDGEFAYVDQTHVEAYGFDSEDELLGNTWRMLYDDEEVGRLESEAFPTLESEGQWRGRVTARRADGTTFPAELSLTIIDDGRLVCTFRDETERLARERELKLKERAMDETDVSIQITDPTREGNPLVYVNDGFERMTGYDREEALGKNPRFLQSTETNADQIRKLREGIANEEPVTVEILNSPADGTEYWAKLSVTPVYDDDGSLTNFIGIQQDVTDQRELVEQLEKRNERLDLVLSKTGTGIVEWDLQADELTWDDTLIEVLGRKPETVEEFFELVHPEDRAEIRTRLEQLLETGRPFRGECRIEKGNGEIAWLETQNILIYEDGEPARVVATGADVTRRKAREEALAESEQRYQTLLRAAPDPVFIADAESGDIVETNAAAATLRGEPQDDIVGRHQSELHPSDDAEAYRTVFEDAIGTTTLVSELPDGSRPELCTADGETVPVEINADTVELPQGRMVYGVFRDISARVEKERDLELKERAMDEANVGITITDPDKPDNPLIYVNDGFVSQTGYSREEALNRNCRFLQADDRDQSALTVLRNAIDSEEPIVVDLRNYRKDGEQFWNRLSVTPVYGDNGEPVNFIGIQQNVTEEKTREQRLQALHRMTRNLLETDSFEAAAAGAVETLSAEFGFHQAAFYRRSGDELLHTTSMGTRTPDPPERIERGQTPLWDAVETGDTVHREDCRALNDGVDHGELVASAYVPVGDHGVVVAGTTQADRLGGSEQQLIEVLAGNLAAVLDSRSREESLRASKKRYRSLAENIPNGAVLTFDADLTYSLAAGELLSTMGIDQTEFVGSAAGTVFADLSAEVVPWFEAALNGERTDRRVEIGDQVLRAHVVPITPGDGDPDDTYGLLLVQDITEEARREHELTRERERFELLTESVDEYAFITIDDSGTVATWNEGAKELFGYDAETAIGMPVAQFHPSESREAGVADRLLEQARISGESADEGWRVREDGSKFYADARYAKLETDDGEFRGYAKIVRDMTERRRQRRRTELFVEESEDVVTIVDSDGIVTYASGSVERVLGYEREEFVGENLFDYIHPESRETAMETFFTSVEDDEETIQTECRFRSGDGNWLNIDGRCRNMLDNNAIEGMLLYLRDVTESKKQARRFQSIFNQTYQFTGLLEPDGTVIEANEAVLDFGGFNREDIVGHPFYEASWWSHSEEVYDRVRDAIERAAGGEFVRYETEVRGEDGLSIIDFSIKPVTDEDRNVSLLVVEGRDITDGIRRRQHLQVMQRVMRHNMRNDLTKLRGFTDALYNEDDPEARQEHFETIEAILNKWESMTEKMRQIRRVLEEHEEPQVTVPAGKLVEDVVAATSDQTSETTVTTSVSADAIQLPIVMTEAVGELVENAIEAADGSDSQVKLTLSESDGEWVDITVQDEGPGLPDAEASVLDIGEETPLNHGQGLGLWMVRMLTKQAGGNVLVDATEDGTTVTLRVPTSEQPLIGR